MLKMRLQRVGRKHEPSFRLVLTDSKNSTKSGRFKEILGSYDPRKSIDSIKADRVKELLSQGVSPTDTVHNLLIKHQIIDAKKKNVLPRKTVEKKEEPAQEANDQVSMTNDESSPNDQILSSEADAEVVEPAAEAPNEEPKDDETAA